MRWSMKFFGIGILIVIGLTLFGIGPLATPLANTDIGVKNDTAAAVLPAQTSVQSPAVNDANILMTIHPVAMNESTVTASSHVATCSRPDNANVPEVTPLKCPTFGLVPAGSASIPGAEILRV